VISCKKGLYSDEVWARYRVVEINGNRAFIEFLCDLPFPPQSVALISELEVIEESVIPERQGS
jgi:hypothetical protein